MNNKKIFYHSDNLTHYHLENWDWFFSEKQYLKISYLKKIKLRNSIDYLLVFPERHLDKIRWIDEIFDDFTASNNSFSRFILLIDLSINKLRYITHASSCWICWTSKAKKEREREKKRKEIIEQSNSPSCQSWNERKK